MTKMLFRAGNLAKGICFMFFLVLALFSYQVKQVSAASPGADQEARFSVSRAEGYLQTSDCSAQTQLPVAECEALSALYNQTNGASWTNHTGWLVTSTPCTWYGVTCGGGHVTRLSLPHNLLSGTIPVELGSLTYLQNLSLPRNQLTGSIPGELGGLTSLQILDLSTNQLSGSIPAVLGNLTGLTQLQLAGNLLTGVIPPELGSLSAMQNLSITRNQLSGPIPPELGSLANLQYLYLGNNLLSGSIPPELSNLSSLLYLSLSSNQLSGPIPAGLSRLSRLQNLSLGANQLTGSIPPELGSLTALRSLDLSGNQLSGSIPSELGSLTYLTSLLLGNNHLTGSIPAGLGGLTSLQVMNLADNQLNGFIPPELGSLSGLQNLSLTNNQISGSIPVTLGSLSGLQYLYLANNQLSGPIPAELGNLAAVRTIELYGNSLSGEIPAALGNLSNVTNLLMGHNKLSGAVPPELGNLANLYHLSLVDNPLTGTIPLSFVNLTKLSILRFYTTYLCEPASAEFLAWKATVATWVGTSTCYGKIGPASEQIDQPVNLTLSWGGTTPATYYEYCYDTTNDDSCAVWINNGLNTTAVLSGLNFSTTYYWQVRSYSGTAGPSYADMGRWWSFTTRSMTETIFNDGFESGDLSAWTANVTDGGDLSVTPGAALVGSSGLQAVIDDNTPIYLTDDSPNADKHYRARFYFDPNTITMASGNSHYILAAYTGASSVTLLAEFGYQASAGYQLRLQTRTDSGATLYTGFYNITDAAHYIELDWQAASAAGMNDGHLTFWIDGVQQATLTGIDNDTRQIDRVRFGAVGGLDTGTRGIYYFDAFASARTAYIGH
jgi:Leucine-rich repeat (LRR) protein